MGWVTIAVRAAVSVSPSVPQMHYGWSVDHRRRAPSRRRPTESGKCSEFVDGVFQRLCDLTVLGGRKPSL